MYKSFRDMPVWVEAMAIAEGIFRLTESLPRKEDCGLTSQIRRSALSISANIPEGFGRGPPKEKINLYLIARGSVAETQNHVEYGRRVHYISEEAAQEMDRRLEGLLHDLNKIVSMLRRQC
jgi:four helix bundle protein